MPKLAIVATIKTVPGKRDGERIARAIGVVLVGVGLLLMARGAGLG